MLRLAGQAPFRLRPLSSNVRRQMQRFSRCLLLAGLSAFASPSALAAPSFELPFWPTPGVERDPRFVRTQEGACGDLALARVRSMPNPQLGDVFATDSAFELDARSRVRRTWLLPANAVPLAASGDRLLVQVDRTNYLISTRGSIEATTTIADLPASAEASCKMPAALRGSGYARCHKLPVIRGSGTVLLAFQGPCT
jgi:hypothetical protein